MEKTTERRRGRTLLYILAPLLVLCGVSALYGALSALSNAPKFYAVVLYDDTSQPLNTTQTGNTSSVWTDVLFDEALIVAADLWAFPVGGASLQSLAVGQYAFEMKLRAQPTLDNFITQCAGTGQVCFADSDCCQTPSTQYCCGTPLCRVGASDTCRACTAVGGNCASTGCCQPPAECISSVCGVPTAAPTPAPTATPTNAPTHTPTAAPTKAPTAAPTNAPTNAPTKAPTKAPTAAPTAAPTSLAPTAAPTAAPTKAPTAAPTNTPTNAPTTAPTASPTAAPTSLAPTAAPTAEPSAGPTSAPTAEPTGAPTVEPTGAPTPAPTSGPTATPTSAPTAVPTSSPTPSPTGAPSSAPTPSPTSAPTTEPTGAPTAAPTPAPTRAPTESPTEAPTGAPTPPTFAPTAAPTSEIVCTSFAYYARVVKQTNGTGPFLPLASLTPQITDASGFLATTFYVQAAVNDVFRFQWASLCPLMALEPALLDLRLYNPALAPQDVSAVVGVVTL